METFLDILKGVGIAAVTVAIFAAIMVIAGFISWMNSGSH